MENIKETYVDGGETIHVLNGTVRLDLFRLQPPQGDEKQADPKVIERLIMPMRAFLNMYATMGQLVEKLREDGVIQLNKEPQNKWDLQN